MENPYFLSEILDYSDKVYYFHDVFCMDDFGPVLRSRRYYEFKDRCVSLLEITENEIVEEYGDGRNKFYLYKIIRIK